MVFRRKKSTTENTERQSVMRGRDRVDNGSEKDPESGRNPLARRFQDDDEPETIDLVEQARFPQSEDKAADEDITRVLVTAPVEGKEPETDFLDDPVAGFLVVVEGPGRGSVSHIGYGLNSIGRDSSQRITLDFGDRHISRETHCLVAFDPVTAKFYVHAGDGRSLCYLNDEPVLAPTELGSGNHLRLGRTVLRFLPLCGEQFSWG